MLTSTGDVFAGRVATSLLHAAWLAPDLTRHPDRLSELKSKLKRATGSRSLFDTERFARHVEAAYAAMWQRWQSGESAASFGVASRDARMGQ